jgi:hypothetical protein
MANKSTYRSPAFNFFVCAGALTLVVMLKVELPLLLGMNPAWDKKILAYRWLLHLHAILGSIALLSAPIQFFPNFRRNHLQLHRRLGRTYALSIFVSAPIGIYIALAHLSNNEKWAATAQGLLWLCTTLMAVTTAMNKQLVMHQIWITRSYALTLTFVVSRFILDVLRIEIGSEFGGNGNLIWVSTLLAITFADIFYASSSQPKISKRNDDPAQSIICEQNPFTV